MPDFAYSAPKRTGNVYDTNYYISLKEKLSVHVYGISKLNSVEFKNSSNDTIIRFKPNENFKLGIGFNYRWAGVSTAFSLRFINNDDRRFGSTTSFDIQSDLFSRRFLSTLTFQAYNGFYWDNIRSFDPSWNISDSFPLRPDITTLNLSISSVYSFNFKKFSLRAPYVHTEMQKLSAGSWLMGAHVSMYSLVSDSALVPVMMSSSLSFFDRSRAITTSAIGIGPGYSYTYVFYRNFYVNAMLMLGLSVNSFESLDRRGRTLNKDVKVAAKTLFRFSIGSNNEKCYYGVSLVAESYPFRNEQHSSFIYNYGRFRLFYGRNFDVR